MTGADDAPPMSVLPHRGSDRWRRPALVVALERGDLDDVPAAIACMRGVELVHANAEWIALIGPGEEESGDAGWLDAFDPRDRAAVVACLRPADPRYGVEVDVRLQRRRRSRWDEIECRVRVRGGVLGDDSEPYRVMTVTPVGSPTAREAQLLHRATHDELTGLATRGHFLAGLADALSTATGPVGCLFVDLDNFKAVNDHLGHRYGDSVLRAVAGRIRSVVRDGAVVGRLGGDEIGVFCPRIDSRFDAFRLAERMTEAISLPFVVGDETVLVDASIGVAVQESPMGDADELVDAADRAMYVAKEAGGAQWASADGATQMLTGASEHHRSHPRWGAVRASVESAEREALLAWWSGVRSPTPESASRFASIRATLRRALVLVGSDTATDVVDAAAD